MALLLGGITSKPSGKTAGVVFGRARTRYGKLATAREWTIPNDPQTESQTENRDLFRLASLTGGMAGSELYQAAWDNVEGLLPGWNAFVAWAKSALELSGIYQWKDTLPPKSLGPVYMPEITQNPNDVDGHLDLTWDGDIVGDHCADEDTLWGFYAAKGSPGSGAPSVFQRHLGTVQRSVELDANQGLEIATEYASVHWFRHLEPDGTYTYSPLSVAIFTSGETP